MTESEQINLNEKVDEVFKLMRRNRPMENLTLEELYCICGWYTDVRDGYGREMTPYEQELYHKLQLAIDDKELTKNDLNF